MEKEPDIVTLESVSTPAVASLIVQALKFEGIPAYMEGCLLQDGFAISQRVFGNNCSEIQVPRSCLAEAQEILKNMREAGKLLEEDPNIAENPAPEEDKAE